MAASERFAEAKAQLREREALQEEQATMLAGEQRLTKQVPHQSPRAGYPRLRCAAACYMRNTRMRFWPAPCPMVEM